MRDAVPWMEWDCSINRGTVAAKPPKLRPGLLQCNGVRVACCRDHKFHSPAKRFSVRSGSSAEERAYECRSA
jgi:hypothetical protein